MENNVYEAEFTDKSETTETTATNEETTTEEKTSFKDKVKGAFGKAKEFFAKESEKESDFDTAGTIKAGEGVISGKVFKFVEGVMKKIRKFFNKILSKLGPVAGILGAIKKVVCCVAAGAAIGYVLVKAILLIPKVLPIIVTYAAIAAIMSFFAGIFNTAFGY